MILLEFQVVLRGVLPNRSTMPASKRTRMQFTSKHTKNPWNFWQMDIQNDGPCKNTPPPSNTVNMAIFGIYVKFQRDFHPRNLTKFALKGDDGKGSRFFPFWDSAYFQGRAVKLPGCSNSATLQSFSHFLQQKIIQASPSSDSQSICTPWNTQQKPFHTFLVDWKCPTTWLEPPAIICCHCSSQTMNASLKS